MRNSIVFCLLILLAGCQVEVASDAEAEKLLNNALSKALEKQVNNIGDHTTFIHNVYIWMNDGVTDDQKADFVKNGLGELVKVPSIYRSYYGPPAGTPREVVDNTYDYALVCQFTSSEDQDKYQDDPIHLKFIEDYKHLWKRVQVYDNLVTK